MRIALIPLRGTGAAGPPPVSATDRRRGGALHPAVRSVARPGDLRPERNRAGLRPVPVQAVCPVVGNRTRGGGKLSGGRRNERSETRQRKEREMTTATEFIDDRPTVALEPLVDRLIAAIFGRDGIGPHGAAQRRQGCA